MPLISAKLQERLLSILGDREDAREMINALQNIVPDTIPPYSFNFNATTDWSLDTVNNNYVITVLQTTHGQGIFPTIQIFAAIGASFDEVSVDQVLINNSGDVSFTIPAVTDDRFAGKIIVS